MDNNVQVQRKTVSMYIREDILSEVDKWLDKKEKETGGKFTRSSFIEKAVIEKIKECGLMENEQK